MKYNLITSEKIGVNLRTHTMGQKIFAFWRVRSTNELAHKLANHGEKEGTIIIAEEQTQGRGRLERRWHSAFGKGLWFSIILRPRMHNIKAGLYPYLAGVSVAQAIENKVGLKPAVKWPNDLLLYDRKFCGILSEVEFFENRLQFIVLGIGINVNHKFADFPDELKEQATSLFMASNKKIDRIQLLTEIIHLFEEHYFYSIEYGFDSVLSNWKRRCPQLGKKIHVVQNELHYYGTFENLDSNGYLILRHHSGNLIKIVAGDFV